jgi:uncharacterized damage-inducible protein DinB
MIGEVLRAHYDYGRWATARVLDASERLTSEQLNAPGIAGHGSIRETLVHMIDTQESWISWLDGSRSAADAMASAVDPDSLPDVAAVRARWDACQAQAEALVGRLSDAAMAADWPLEPPGREPIPTVLWQLLLHVSNHGVQHRSDIAAMLTEHGQSPGNLDLLFYLIERKAGYGA